MKPTLLSILVSTIIVLTSCQQQSTKTVVHSDSIENNGHTYHLYSKNVGDSFTLSVMLPGDYETNQQEKYPVVYMLDGNFYFNIISSGLKTYSEVGLAPNVILVAIGYKDLAVMDSLRNRDYTGPKAFPQYEMAVSGGADKFLRFINEELNPYIDQHFRIDSTQRTLAGHSLGGYFVVYALYDQLEGRSKSFHNFIAASPSFNYNNYHLLDEFKKLRAPDQDSSVQLYITFGGLEDEEDADEPGVRKVHEVSKEFTKILSDKFPHAIDLKYDYFSNLQHMETPYPSFMKGLQWELASPGDSD